MRNRRRYSEEKACFSKETGPDGCPDAGRRHSYRLYSKTFTMNT